MQIKGRIKNLVSSAKKQDDDTIIIRIDSETDHAFWLEMLLTKQELVDLTKSECKVGDWVMRVSYPVEKLGYSQNFKHILPNMVYRVTEVDIPGQYIVIQVIHDMQITYERFWIGNFVKVTTTEMIDL